MKKPYRGERGTDFKDLKETDPSLKVRSEDGKAGDIESLHID